LIYNIQLNHSWYIDFKNKHKKEKLINKSKNK
jgi:hypothetical protein